jgi:hypothetical protein
MYDEELKVVLKCMGTTHRASAIEITQTLAISQQAFTSGHTLTGTFLLIYMNTTPTKSL